MNSEKIREKFNHHLDARINDEAMTSSQTKLYWLTYLCEIQSEIAAQLADLNENIKNKPLTATCHAHVTIDGGSPDYLEGLD